MDRFDGGSLRTVIKEQLHLCVLATVLHPLAHKIQHRPSSQMRKVFQKKKNSASTAAAKKIFALPHKQCFNLVKHIFLSCQLQNRIQFYCSHSRQT